LDRVQYKAATGNARPQKNSRRLNTVIGGTAAVFVMAIDEDKLLIINLNLGPMLGI